jgi:hypothetical protein
MFRSKKNTTFCDAGATKIIVCESGYDIIRIFYKSIEYGQDVMSHAQHCRIRVAESMLMTAVGLTKYSKGGLWGLPVISRYLRCFFTIGASRPDHEKEPGDGGIGPDGPGRDGIKAVDWFVSFLFQKPTN